MPTGITEIANVSQEVIDSIVQRSLKRKAILLPTVGEYSRLVKKGTNGVKLPRAGSFTASAKVENTATGFQNLSPVNDTISLNLYKHIPSRIEDDVREESTVNMEALYVRRMAEAMGRQMDDDIYAAIAACADGTGTDEDGALLPDHEIVSGGTISKSLILDARSLLNKQEASEDRWLIVNPDEEATLLAITDFIDASKYGSSQPVQLGELGRVFGIRVVMSNLVPSGEWCMYTREHVGFIRNISMKFETQRAPLQYLADDLSLSTKYGVGTLQLGRLGVHAS